MKITSLVDIVNGKLQNKPSISFVTQLHTNILKVKDGDLFISSDMQKINEAVQKGAFAIIYDCTLDISTLNNEIAYINVTSIKDACIKLLRYYLSTKTIDVIYVDPISFELFKIYKTQVSSCVHLNNNILENFDMIQNKLNLNTIFSTNNILLNNIYPENKKFKLLHYELSNLIVHSLFETSFSYKNKYFYKLKLPLIYIDNFINVMKYLKITNIDVNKLKTFQYMKATFINKSNQIIEDGNSNKFIIANSSKNIYLLEIEFLKKIYSFGTIKILDETIVSNVEILQIIKQQNYNALYITSKTQNEIINLLNQNSTKQIELF
jgi:hypothetical protein